MHTFENDLLDFCYSRTIVPPVFNYEAKHCSNKSGIATGVKEETGRQAEDLKKPDDEKIRKKQLWE